MTINFGPGLTSSLRTAFDRGGRSYGSVLSLPMTTMPAASRRATAAALPASPAPTITIVDWLLTRLNDLRVTTAHRSPPPQTDCAHQGFEQDSFLPAVRGVVAQPIANCVRLWAKFACEGEAGIRSSASSSS